MCVSDCRARCPQRSRPHDRPQGTLAKVRCPPELNPKSQGEGQFKARWKGKTRRRSTRRRGSHTRFQTCQPSHSESSVRQHPTIPKWHQSATRPGAQATSWQAPKTRLLRRTLHSHHEAHTPPSHGRGSQRQTLCPWPQCTACGRPCRRSWQALRSRGRHAREARQVSATFAAQHLPSASQPQVPDLTSCLEPSRGGRLVVDWVHFEPCLSRWVNFGSGAKRRREKVSPSQQARDEDGHHLNFDTKQLSHPILSCGAARASLPICDVGLEAELPALLSSAPARANRGIGWVCAQPAAPSPASSSGKLVQPPPVPSTQHAPVLSARPASPAMSDATRNLLPRGAEPIIPCRRWPDELHCGRCFADCEFREQPRQCRLAT